MPLTTYDRRTNEQTFIACTKRDLASAETPAHVATIHVDAADGTQARFFVRLALVNGKPVATIETRPLDPTADNPSRTLRAHFIDYDARAKALEVAT